MTGDEFRIYGYDPETKQQLSQWKSPKNPRPKKGRQVRSKTNVRLLAFSDSECILHHQYAPDRQTINKEFYVEFLRRLRESVRLKDRKNGGMATGSCTTTMRPHTLHIFCSSFWPNTAPLSSSSRHTHQISPLCDFFLFPRLKKVLKGHRFQATEDIKRNSTKTLLDILKEEFAKCFQQWQKCWAKCVAAEGNYVEEN